MNLKNRTLLYDALLAKLKPMMSELPWPPESWTRFLAENEIVTWGFRSDLGPEDLRYRFPDHVWIHSPEGEVADDLGEDWDYREFRSVLLIPKDFARDFIEKSIKKLVIDWLIQS